MAACGVKTVIGRLDDPWMDVSSAKPDCSVGVTAGGGMNMRFNRNIIIQADVDRYMDPGSRNPKTLTANPPSVPAQAAPGPAGGGPEPGGVTVPSEDDYLTKVVKYIPVEVLAAYLFMAGVIDSNVTDQHDHAIWLGGLLIGILVLTIPYDLRVLNVVRWQQVAMSVVAIAVYVFAVGGWFATTTWYHQWYASIVVPVFGLVIAILKLPPLPADPNAPPPQTAPTTATAVALKPAHNSTDHGRPDELTNPTT
jgi:hypothetical protein